MNYQCKYGLFHDKSVENNEPRSNNGWIYTALSKYTLNISYERLDFFDLYLSCQNETSSLYSVNRLPGKELPPISRDEVIGMASLRQPIVDVLIQNNWKMYNDILDKIPLSDTIKTLWKIRKKHRNYYWENEILEAYPVAMALFPHDRYYIKKMSFIKPSAIEFYFFYLYAWNIIFRGSPGEQNLLYLQLRDLGSYLYKFIPFKKNILKYFGKEHIFNRHILN